MRVVEMREVVGINLETPQSKSPLGNPDYAIAACGFAIWVFIKKALFKVLQRHQNVVHQIGVRVQFVCDSAAGWLRPQTSLCVSWTPKERRFWDHFLFGRVNWACESQVAAG